MAAAVAAASPGVRSGNPRPASGVVRRRRRRAHCWGVERELAISPLHLITYRRSSQQERVGTST